jgi:hypothetical protein
MYKPRGKAQSYSLDKVLVQWETLKHFHRRLVEISGVEENQQIDEFLDNLQTLLSSPQFPSGAEKHIYVVQTEIQRENNCVKVGFCSNVKSRWGSQWGKFANRTVFNSPFRGDAEVHSHLRKHFERDDNQGREVYFGEFDNVCQVISNFLR